MLKAPSHGRRVDIKKCIELYRSGLSINEVGRRLNHHHGVIRYNLIRSGIKIRGQKIAQRKPIESTVIAEKYAEGMSAVEIAKEMGVSYQCIYSRLAELGVKTRSRKEQIKHMMLRGTYNIKRGPENGNWKGGTTIDGNGYRYINVDGNYVAEHRYVWESHHGALPEGWIVHHLNGNKLDNRLENLTAMPRKAHSPKSIIEPFRNRIAELEREIKLLKKRV